MIDGQCWIGASDGVSIVVIVENGAVLLMEGLGGDVFVDGLRAIQLVGLRVSLIIYKEFVRHWSCSSQQLLLPPQTFLTTFPRCFLSY